MQDRLLLVDDDASLLKLLAMRRLCNHCAITRWSW